MHIKVSALIPTRNRAQWIEEAIECYLSQTWENKELVIVDDEDAPSLPNGIDIPGVIYHRLSERLSIGRKRNSCWELATGDIITHLYDGWSGPNRFEHQANLLINHSKILMTGYDQSVFANRESRQAWLYKSGSSGCGTSMAYWRSFWQTHRFPNK